jgi:asparagine synthase (glutamine-hydrolysing)
MCGIAGKISLTIPVSLGELEHAGASLRHRGPDDKGVYLSENKKVGFAHQRLSLLDLTSAGHQPMQTENGALTIVYNGEIYNYIELKEELSKQGYIFQTSSDTEVIIIGYQHWGIQVLNRLKGMFAFAIHDLNNKQVILARDRFGIKPLYFAQQVGLFCFGSEIKAILAFDNLNKQLRHSSISGFLANRYVPGNFTMWEGIRKLGIGGYMRIDTETLDVQEDTYWKLSTTLHQKDKSDVVEKFGFLLEKSLKEHLRSDVQIGSFLSGGMDSSALLTLMNKKLHYTGKAFSIGFNNWENSEDKYAKEVAKHCGASLKTLNLDKIDLNTVSKLMVHYDDPIADISILPTYAVSGLAAGEVKAVISGEGADELLGGYWWQKPKQFYYRNLLEKWGSKLNGIGKQAIKTHYIEAMSMGLFDRSELKMAFSDEWRKEIPDDPFSHFDVLLQNDLPVLKQIQYLDIHTFMSELILTKVDRASMAHSLEVRVPFLDHELVEYLYGLPQECYFRSDIQKWLLQRLVRDLLPQGILDRPKQGFVGPDKFYMDFELYRNKLLGGNLVSNGIIRKKYIQYLLFKRDHWRLWKLFVLEHWWDNWV